MEVLVIMKVWHIELEPREASDTAGFSPIGCLRSLEKGWEVKDELEICSDVFCSLTVLRRQTFQVGLWCSCNKHTTTFEMFFTPEVK